MADRTGGPMMGVGPYASPVDVFLVLSGGDEVLLALRENTGYADGQWNLPSGKVEQGEHVLAAVLREAREEVGLWLKPGEVRLAATVHLLSAAGQGRLGCSSTSRMTRAGTASR